MHNMCSVKEIMPNMCLVKKIIKRTKSDKKFRVDGQIVRKWNATKMEGSQV